MMLVERSYAALEKRDTAAVGACFTPQATLPDTRREPDRGAAAIAERTQQAIERLDGRWCIENAPAGADQACIEWTMSWRAPETGEPSLDRAAEWFSFEDGLISEVRAYHHGSPRNPAGELIGFDRAGRGHHTL
ncbi:MAG: hypothetical protein NVSMB51_07250 [Solirubrobacteraceae bacterium]